MIPREILKKNRQTKLRTNRIVTGFAAGARVCDPHRPRITYNRIGSWRALSGETAAGHRPALRGRGGTTPDISNAPTNYYAVRLLRAQQRSVSASPKGCQKLAGGRSASEDPRYDDKTDTTLEGSQNLALKWMRTILAPLQGAAIFSAVTGGIAVLLRATAQPPANFLHAFSVPVPDRFRADSLFVIHPSPFSTA